MMTASPIQHLGSLSNRNDVYMKRDDLLPFSFGGNKVRIAECFFRDMEATEKDVMVAYGNARSNLVRAIANMAFAREIPCYIISPADDDGKVVETANASLSALLGARFVRCDKSQVRQTIELLLTELSASGADPYYIYGNSSGTGNREVPVRAYAEAYREIKEYEAQHSMGFDMIFLPTGTGMTQSGLICGEHLLGGTADIVGISVARESIHCCREIRGYIDAYLRSSGECAQRCDPAISVLDGYRAGGYGRSDDRIEEMIMRLMRDEGIPADPVYVGKGFSGMMSFLDAEGIRGAKVLFIHTGGTPLFFDWLSGRMG